MTAWLLTWLWQGSALIAGVAVALRCASRLNAATRHLIWFGALAGLLWLGWGSSTGFVTAAPSSIEPVLYVPSAPEPLIAAIVRIWMSVALVGLVRVLPSLHALYTLRDRSVPFPQEIESRLPLWLEAKERGRRADLMICDALPGATVLGLQRPCIALPTSLVEALTTAELDQVILHEHAHVQRRDDWWRLTQALLVSVLWIHPAALLVSRALHREREMACDEWVVARTGLPKAYARCLARAAEVRGRARENSVLAPALLGKRYELVRRVERLLALRGSARRHVSFAGMAAATVAITVSAAHIQAVRIAEIAEVVLPSVARPIFVAYDAGLVRLAPEMVELNPEGVRLKPQVVRLKPQLVRLKPDTTYGEVSSADTMYVPTTAAAAPVAPTAPTAPSIAFAGVYSGPRTSVEPGSEPKGWSALGAPGVEITSAAKKTSSSIASLFSRAGASLARSF